MAAVETSEGARMPNSPAASDEAGVRAKRRAFRLSFTGLLTTMALASLDQNIVSTALPRIVSELGGLAHLPWVITAFMLTATATTPLYGKLSDMHGRRPSSSWRSSSSSPARRCAGSHAL
jgi:MFS family permease